MTSPEQQPETVYDAVAPEHHDEFERDWTMAATDWQERRLLRLGHAAMRPGDVVAISFGGDSAPQRVLEVLEVRQAGSLVFGSEHLADRRVAVKFDGMPDGLKNENKDEDELGVFELRGSVLGTENTGPVIRDAITVGDYMFAGETVLPGRVTFVDLMRPDEQGELQSVTLDPKEPETYSESYIVASETFTMLEHLLESVGFKFDDVQDELLHKRYKEVSNQIMVYAGRRNKVGFSRPQDEVWVYDAESKILRALRRIPAEGVMQLAVIEDVNTEMFARVGGWHTEGATDWKMAWPYSGMLRQLSKEVPVVTYSWLEPAQKQPVVTVLDNGKKAGDLLRKPDLSQAALGVTALRGDTGLHIPEHRLVGGEQPALDRGYAPLEVDIFPEGLPRFHTSAAALQVTGEMATAFTAKVESGIVVVPYEDGRVDLQLGKYEKEDIPVNTTPSLKGMLDDVWRFAKSVKKTKRSSGGGTV